MASEWLTGQPQQPPWNEVDWAADPASDWRTAPEDDPDSAHGRWQQAVDRSRALFATAAAKPAGTRPPEAPSLTYILVNMIEEYARHDGNADLIRSRWRTVVRNDPPS